MHTLGQFRVTNEPMKHAFGLKGETGKPGENSRMHKENVQTPHSRTQLAFEPGLRRERQTLRHRAALYYQSLLQICFCSFQFILVE